MPLWHLVVYRILAQRAAIRERSSRPTFSARHFASWFKALSIGWLEIRIRPSKGWSNSMIRKIAPDTARAENIKARMAVELGGERTLKQTKIIASQKTRMMSISIEIEGTDCAASSDGTSPRSVSTLAA